MTSTESPASKDRKVPSYWRALAIFLVLILLLAWAASTSMIEQLKAQVQQAQSKLVDVPQIRHISVLLDDQQQPAMLVTLDPKQGQLHIQRLNEVKEGREDSMQLWAVNGTQTPVSLGVIESKYKTLQMPAPASALDGASELAISVESKGGVSPTTGPRLPWLFKGALVQKAL